MDIDRCRNEYRCVNMLVFVKLALPTTKAQKQLFASINKDTQYPDLGF
jgi:hypothetical protein